MMLPHPRVVKIKFRHRIEANIWDLLLTLKNVKEKVFTQEYMKENSSLSLKVKTLIKVSFHGVLI